MNSMQRTSKNSVRLACLIILAMADSTCSTPESDLDASVEKALDASTMPSSPTTWGRMGRATTVALGQGGNLLVSGVRSEGGAFLSKLSGSGDLNWDHELSFDSREVPIASTTVANPEGEELIVITRVVDGETANESTTGEVWLHRFAVEDGIQLAAPLLLIAPAKVYAISADFLDDSVVVAGAIASSFSNPDLEGASIPHDKEWVASFDLNTGIIEKSWQSGEGFGDLGVLYSRAISVSSSVAGTAIYGCGFFPEFRGEEKGFLRLLNDDFVTATNTPLGAGDIQCRSGSVMTDGTGSIYVAAPFGYAAGSTWPLQKWSALGGKSPELEWERQQNFDAPQRLTDLRMLRLDGLQVAVARTQEIFETKSEWQAFEVKPDGELGMPSVVLDTALQELMSGIKMADRKMALVGQRENNAMVVFFTLPP